MSTPAGQITFPTLQEYARIQRIIDRGRGLAANVVGQPGNVYRLQSTVSGAFVQADTEQLINFMVLRKVVEGGLSMETHEGMGLVYFMLVCDLTYLETGDVWIQNDPFYGKGATLVDYTTNEFVGICVAHHAVAKPSYGIQLNRLATYVRPSSAPDGTGYYQSGMNGGQPLQIVNGAASFGAVGATADAIPIGLNPTSRPKKDQMKPYVPGMTGEADYFCYVPPIPGFIPQEGDYIQTLNGSRYIVEIPWHLEAGIVGSSMSVRRVNVQTNSAGGA